MPSDTLNKILAFIAARRQRRFGRLQEEQIRAQMGREERESPLRMRSLEEQIAAASEMRATRKRRAPTEEALAQVGLESQQEELARRRQRAPMEEELAGIELESRRGEAERRKRLAPFEESAAVTKAMEGAKTPSQQRGQVYKDFVAMGLESGLSPEEAQKFALYSTSPAGGQMEATKAAAAATTEVQAVERFKRVFPNMSPFEAGKKYFSDVQSFLRGDTFEYPSIGRADIPQQYLNEFESGWQEAMREAEGEVKKAGATGGAAAPVGARRHPRHEALERALGGSEYRLGRGY